MNLVSVFIYINGVRKKLDLFSDEKISVTSSSQNYNDLGKIFTDFSQSFTIPASKNNNKIFSHWYENSIDNGYDHRIRYQATIKINSVLFKEGKIQIEKANKKNGFTESYGVTFYGNLVQLKDLFKEQKINQLDYSDIEFDYVPAGVLALIESNVNADLKFPIFGNNQKYKYLSGQSGDLTNSSVLDYRDLFPAIRLSKIFQYIQTKYSITFNGSFFSSTTYTDLFLELKNTEKMVGYARPSFVYWDFIESIEYPVSWSGSTLSTNFVRLKLNITPDNGSVGYKVTIYKDNVIYITYNLIGDRSGARGLTFYDKTKAQDGVDSVWKVKIESTVAQQFNVNIFRTKLFNGVTTTDTTYNAPAANGTILDLAKYCPDITVYNFLSGIIKQFNLMITPKSATEFEFETLDNYYAGGNILDLTKHFYSNENDVLKPALFQKISFKYQKSENITNNYFRNLVTRGYDYGDLNYEDIKSNESSSYAIELPFECCMFDRSIELATKIPTNFITVSFIKQDLKEYLPKPFIFYRNGLKSLPTPIRMVRNDAGDYYNISTYNEFSSDNLITNASLTFDNEISSYDYTIRNGLYNSFYSNYIQNLYNIKTRIISIKAVLPISKLTTIRLKDRIVIRNKRYLINTITTDLTTGESTFNLITDFRTV